jgi:putative phosphoesterase
MKILVVSDNHGKLVNMNLVEQEEYDYLFHLGDSQMSHDFIASRGYTCVVGNCDHDFNYDSEKVIEIEDKRILLTHGHLRNINDVTDLEQVEELYQFDLVLFGHLHIPYVEEINGTIFSSPGSIEYPRGNYRYPTFSKINIINDKIDIEHFAIINGEVQRIQI